MADEVLAVEAVPLEEDFDTLVASLAIDDTLEDKLVKLKKHVDEKLAGYMGVKRIEKDEDFKAAKKYRTSVNDVKKPIEAQRKAAKKKYSDLLKTFDKTIGEITAPIDRLSDEYKAEIDRYDGECRKRRLTALKGHYCDLAGEMGPLVHIEPMGVMYIHVKPEDCHEILEKTVLGGEVIARLVYHLDGTAYPKQEDIPFYKKQHRVVLENCGTSDAEDIEEYIAKGGYSAFEKALFEMTDEEICRDILDSGLRGRGGAGRARAGPGRRGMK